MKNLVSVLLLSFLCLLLNPFPGFAQTSFIDLEHPFPRGPERTRSIMIPGADGHVFIVNRNGYLLRSTDDGFSWDPLETPFQDEYLYEAAGSHDGILVVSSDKRVNENLSGNTWISEDNGLTWQGLGNLLSGSEVHVPTFWIKPESITLRREKTMVYSGVDFYTIYDYEGDWTSDSGGEYVLPNGDELVISKSYGIDCYTVCNWLVLIRQDEENIGISVYEEDGEEILGFYIWDLAVVSDEHWVLTTSFGIHITEDAGETWTVQDEEPFLNSSRLTRTPDGKIFLETTDSSLFESSDNGYSWTEVDLSDNEAMLPGNGQYVVSSNGYLYAHAGTSANDFMLRSVNYLDSGDGGLSTEMPASVSLHPNYPNPFNPVTSITFDLPEPAVTTLEIYNLQGRLVERLLGNTLLASGTHQFSWDAGRRASGMYVYRLRAGNEIHAQKMLLLK